MYSQPWSPTPSTTAVAPELRTQKRSPATPLMNAVPPRSAVQCHVADDDVLAAVKGGVLRRVDDELAAGQTLADVVIRVSDQLERQALGDERAEALAAVAWQTTWNVSSAACCRTWR